MSFPLYRTWLDLDVVATLNERISLPSPIIRPGVELHFWLITPGHNLSKQHRKSEKYMATY